MVKTFLISITLTLVAGTAWANQDPTAPLDWQQPVGSSNTQSATKRYRLPKLNSIVCQANNQCTAIMNDHHIVEQGQWFRGYQVVSITSELVTVKRGKRQWKLELFGLNVKK